MSTKEFEFATLSGNGQLEISQYAGIIGNPILGTDGKYYGGFNINCDDFVKNGYPDFPESHQFYRATDICPASPQTVLYAPCELRCIYHGTFEGINDLDEEVSTGTCIMTAFETVNTVYCADGIARNLTLILFHGGDKFNGEVGDVFAKNSILYYEGSQGMDKEVDHIHMDILNWKCSL